jgi:hypothetical protein
MENPTITRRTVSADNAEFSPAELESFVATSKQHRPFAWSRVEHLKQACHLESSANAACVNRSERLAAEQSVV